MTSKNLRQTWLATLAQAPRELLEGHAARRLGEDVRRSFEWLRAPETGLTMVQARVGGGGDRFNVGETTLTRCIVRHRDDAGRVAAGIGYVKGRDADRARWVAMFDALLQQPDHHASLIHDVIAPLDAAIRARRAKAEAATQTSRVRFFTLDAGDA